jgi:hypothetical protein
MVQNFLVQLEQLKSVSNKHCPSSLQLTLALRATQEAATEIRAKERMIAEERARADRADARCRLVEEQCVDEVEHYRQQAAAWQSERQDWQNSTMLLEQKCHQLSIRNGELEQRVEELSGQCEQAHLDATEALSKLRKLADAVAAEKRELLMTTARSTAVQVDEGADARQAEVDKQRLLEQVGVWGRGCDRRG